MELRAENIRVTDPSGKKVLLDRVGFALEEGTITLVLGVSGAGKSTLLDALSGLAPLAGGAVLYGGRPLWKGRRPDPEVLARFGNVFQLPERQLFARTVRGEFEYSLRFLRLTREEADRRTGRAMDRMGLAPALLERSPLFLSGGQKRRVALASTLSVEPRWLIMDEPAAGMDPPSVRRLVRFLEDWKRSARGSAIVATHQVEEFLPLADRFLFLKDGRLLADADREELVRRPGLWEEAGLEMPPTLAVLHRLRERGLEVPGRIPDPRELAALIARGRPVRGDSGPRAPVPEKRADAPAGAPRLEALLAGAVTAAMVPAGGDARPDAAEEKPAEPFLAGLDPRVKWFVYVLFSAAALLQDDWWGLAACAATAAVWHRFSGLKGRTVLIWCLPFALFTAVSAVVAGFEFRAGEDPGAAGVGFSPEAAAVVLFRMGKIAVAMVVGILFALTTSFARMKLGLDQMLHLFRRFRLPVEGFSLTAALMIRFVPVLRQELERFSRIVRARGKDAGRPGALAIRHVPALMIPMMLSLLQWADDLALVLAARGVGRTVGQQNIRSPRLRMRKSDRAALALGVAWALLLAVWRFAGPV